MLRPPRIAVTLLLLAAAFLQLQLGTHDPLDHDGDEPCEICIVAGHQGAIPVGWTPPLPPRQRHVTAPAPIPPLHPRAALRLTDARAPPSA